MTPINVKAEILRLKHEGKDLKTISQLLAEKGIMGPVSGKPFSVGSLSYIIKGAKRKAPPRRRALAQPKAALSRATGPAGRKDRVTAVTNLLKLRGMDAEERIALALMVLEA